MIAGQFDFGPPQVRRRSLARVDRFRHAYCLNESDSRRLRLFIRDDLADGALPFSMYDPQDERWVTMQLDPESEIEFAPIGKGFYRCTLDLLVLPG